MSTGQLNGVIRRIHQLAGLRELAACSDGQLMERFVKDQDEHAFELLLERHGPMVLGVCRRVLHQTQDAEDAFQATFLVFMRKASSVRSRETVGNWLYGVAFRTSIKAKAAAAKRTFKEKQGNPMKRHAPAQADVWHDIQPVLDEELERLPDKYRSLIVLCDLEGKSRKEVAEKLKLADGTLSSRLATARKLLAQRLTKRGITLSVGALAAMFAQNLASAAVPKALSASTIQAVHVMAAGGATAGVISSNVAALSEGVLKAMFLTKLKSALAMILVIGMFAGGAITLATYGATAQQPDSKKDAKTQEQPEKKEAKQPETKKQVAKKEDAKKPTDAYPFDDLKTRLKKHEDEIGKIRQTMLKEIADEESKIAVLIKKEQDAFAGGDKPALARASALQNKKAQLGSLRFQVQAGVLVGGKPPVPLTEEQRLGIHVGTPSAAIVKQLALPKNQGLVLDKVDAKSPAEKAGLKALDILLKIDGKVVPSDKKEFHKILAGIKTDSSVDAVVLREGKEQTIQGLILPAATAPTALQTPVSGSPSSAESDKKNEE